MAVPNHDSVSDYEGAGRIMAQAVDSFGSIDILVNNAGIVRDRTLLKMDGTTTTPSSPCTRRAPSTAPGTPPRT